MSSSIERDFASRCFDGLAHAVGNACRAALNMEQRGYLGGTAPYPGECRLDTY